MSNSKSKTSPHPEALAETKNIGGTDVALRHVEKALPGVGGILPPTPTIHDTIRTWTSILGCLAAITGVLIACIQIGKVNETIAENSRREVQSATVRAIETYQTNSILVEARKRVYAASKKGKFYVGMADNIELHRDVLDNMNFLELIAIGVHQGVYSEEMFKDFFILPVSRYVPIFLFGSSKIPEWETDKAFFPPSDFPNLVATYNRWNPTTPVSYKNQTN